MDLDPEPVLIVVNSGYEKRYYFSAAQAAEGTGYLNWHLPPDSHGEMQVYRLDTEATQSLTHALEQDRDTNGPPDFYGPNWKSRKARFSTIIQNITGIKPGPKRRKK